MDEKWIEQIRLSLESKDSDELLQIWQANDREAWRAEAFVAIRQILEERGVDPGLQDQPAAAPAGQRARPGCVTAFVILMGIEVAVFVLGSLANAALAPYIDTGSKLGIGITLVFAALYAAVAVGLWQLKNWARIAVIVLLSLNILLLVALLFSGIFGIPSALGLLVGGYSIYWFAAHGETFKPV
jgi:hypothetical protein